MADHTPGPWRIEPQNRHDAWIKSESGKVVAYIHNVAYRPHCDIDPNARLISAAPDLLAALVGLLKEPTISTTIACSRKPDMAFGARVPDYLRDCQGIVDAADAAEAAVSKALGETHVNPTR